MSNADILSFMVMAVVVSGCGWEQTEETMGFGAWRIDPTPVLVLGEMEGASEYTFDWVLSTQLVDGERFVVADFGRPSLRVYSLAGEFVAEMGGRGEGPGEFGGIAGMWLSPPDTVSIYDHQRFRRTSFLVDGTFLESTVLEREGHPDHVVGSYSDGSIVLGWLNYGSEDGPLVPDEVSYGRWTRDGGYAGSVAEEGGTWRYMPSTGTGPVPLTGIHPFSPSPYPWIHGDTLFFTDGLGPDLILRNRNGEMIGTIPIPVSGGSVEEARRALSRSLQEEDIDRDLDGVPQVDSVPRIAGLVIGDEGLLWLKKYDPSKDALWLESGRPRRGGEWWVIDREGAVHSIVSLPDDLILMGVRDSLIIGTTIDDLGVHRVLVYRILNRK